MPFTPSRLNERRVRVSFPFDGDLMSIEYRPAALNEAMQQRLKAVSDRLSALNESPKDDAAAAEEQRLSLEFATCASEILTWWDYYEDGEGSPMVPLTAERILAEMKQYTDFVTACILAPLQDYQQSKLDGAVSSSPSAGISSPTDNTIISMTKRSQNASK